MTTAAEPDFEGHAGRDCGEHRTVGPRAWCHSCVVWCYPDEPCAGCELPALRAAIRRARAVPVDAPAYYDANTAHGWEAGRNAVLDAIGEAP